MMTMIYVKPCQSLIHSFRFPEGRPSVALPFIPASQRVSSCPSLLVHLKQLFHVLHRPPFWAPPCPLLIPEVPLIPSRGRIQRVVMSWQPFCPQARPPLSGKMPRRACDEVHGLHAAAALDQRAEAHLRDFFFSSLLSSSSVSWHWPLCPAPHCRTR